MTGLDNGFDKITILQSHIEEYHYTTICALANQHLLMLDAEQASVWIEFIYFYCLNCIETDI